MREKRQNRKEMDLDERYGSLQVTETGDVKKTAVHKLSKNERSFMRFIQEDRAEVEARKHFNMNTPLRMPTEATLDPVQLYLAEHNTPSIPTRPAWTYDMTKEELQESESTYFKEWLSQFGVYEEGDDIDEDATPALPAAEFNFFETNLEVWRQLWRTVERATVVVVVIDSRFPIAQLPRNLYQYVTDLGKPLIVIMNKVDLLPESVVARGKASLTANYPNIAKILTFNAFNKDRDDGRKRAAYAEGRVLLEAIVEAAMGLPGVGSTEGSTEGLELGFIGHPSVGKSSVLNALLGKKLVSVKRTPGHTKHFQTHKITVADHKVTVCDCPGLVIPIRDMPRPMQVITGVYPLGKVREFLSSTRLAIEIMLLHWVDLGDAFITHLTRLAGRDFARQFSEAVDSARALDTLTADSADSKDDSGSTDVEVSGPGVKIAPTPANGPADLGLTPYDVLAAVAYQRGFVTKGGNPDTHRAGRIFLKEIVDGDIMLYF